MRKALSALCGRGMADDVTLSSVAPFHRLIGDDEARLNESGGGDRLESETAKFATDPVRKFLRAIHASLSSSLIGRSIERTAPEGGYSISARPPIS